MKQFAIFVVLILLLIIGGGLTSQFVANNNSPNVVLPTLKQTENPDASVFSTVPWKAEQLFLLIGFVLFNMIGMGATIALVMWFLHRGVRRSKAEGSSTSIQAASSERAVEQA